MSALSVAELIVGPSKAGAAALATMEGFLMVFAEMRVAPFGSSPPILPPASGHRRAALPDAAVVATALEHDAALIVTIDDVAGPRFEPRHSRSWSPLADDATPGSPAERILAP